MPWPLLLNIFESYYNFVNKKDFFKYFEAEAKD